MRNEREIVWKFRIEDKVVEVVSTEKKTDALVELGRAIGVGGLTKKSILNNVYSLKPKFLNTRPIFE